LKRLSLGERCSDDDDDAARVIDSSCQWPSEYGTWKTVGIVIG
jgi:hypothetical protein